MTEGEFAPFIEGLIKAEEHDRKLMKPCPFCGADPIHLTLECEDGNWFIYCATCDMIVEHAYPGLSKEKLIAHWNRRVKE